MHSPFANQSKNMLLCGVRYRSVVLIMLSIGILLSAMPFEAQASSGSYDLKWYAADPAVNNAPYLPTYIKYTPAYISCPGSAGRHSGSTVLPHAVLYGPTSANRDAVTSLAPRTLALGQIVPFEFEISVTGSTSPENGIIKFSTSFNTNTTSGSNFGFDPTYKVYCAFVDTSDPGTIDPGNNAKVDSYTSGLNGTGTNQYINGTFQVSGLDNGDNIVVEVWVFLKSKIPSGSTGNVQTNLIRAQTANGTKINFGAQTVPILRIDDVNEFFTEINDISITKTDIPDPVVQGQQLTYNLTLRNNGASNVSNMVIATDTLSPSLSFVSASVSSYTIDGRNITFNAGSLSPGETKNITIVTSVSSTAPTNNDTSMSAETGGYSIPTFFDIYNRVLICAMCKDADPSNNIYYQPTNVLASNPSLSLYKKISTSATGPWSSMISVDGNTPVYYQFTITNTGNVPLTSLSITDPTVSTSSITWPASLAVGGTATGVVGPVTTQTSAGTYSNTATASGSYGSGTYTSALSLASYVIHPVPALTLHKEISTSATGPWSSMISVDGNTPVYYQFTITNAGNVPLTSLSITDPTVSTSSITWPSLLAVGGTATGVVGPVTTQTSAGTYSNTATASGSYGTETSVSLPSSASYAVNQVASLSLEKEISTSSTGPWSYMITADGGTAVYYKFTITNTGSVPLTSLSINDPAVSTSGITWPSSLAVGGTATGVVGPVTAESLAGTYSNTATASGKYGTETPVSLPSSASYVIIPLPSLSLDKKISTSETGPWLSSISILGSTPVYYQFTITNTGNVPLTSLSINDPAVSTSGITWPSSLAVGGTATGIAGPVTAESLAGTYSNTATASGTYEGVTFPSAPSSSDYIVSSYTYDFDESLICGTTVTLTITSTTPDGLSLLVICKNGSTEFYRTVVEKSSGVYTCVIPLPAGLSGECSIEIAEYSGSQGSGSIIGQDISSFSVTCGVPEFPVGSSVFLLVTGVGYLGMRKKLAGFLNGKR